MQIKTDDLDFAVTNLTHNGNPISGGDSPQAFIDKALAIDGSVDIAEFPLGTDEYAALEIKFVARVTDGTDQELTSGIYVLQAVDKNGTISTNYMDTSNGAKTHAGFLGAIQISLIGDEANDKVKINVSHGSNGMTPTSGTITLEVTKNWQGVTITEL